MIKWLGISSLTKRSSIEMIGYPIQSGMGPVDFISNVVLMAITFLIYTLELNNIKCEGYTTASVGFLLLNIISQEENTLHEVDGQD